MVKQEKVSGLEIRQAVVQDMKEIENVMKRSMEKLGQGYYTEKQLASICEFVCIPDKQIIEDGTYFVVENKEGEMLACGGWSYRRTLYAGPEAQTSENNLLDPTNDSARIRAMFVLPLIAGKGAGSLILQASEQAAKDYGFKQGRLGATQSGLAFYQAKGWKPVKEEEAIMPNKVKIEVTQMEKIFQ